MGASATTWPVSDLVRLLLAMAKAKKASASALENDRERGWAISHRRP